MSYWLCKAPAVGASGAIFGLVSHPYFVNKPQFFSACFRCIMSLAIEACIKLQFWRETNALKRWYMYMFEVIDLLSFEKLRTKFHNNTIFFVFFCFIIPLSGRIKLRFLSSLEITIFLPSHIILSFHQNLNFDQSECVKLCKWDKSRENGWPQCDTWEVKYISSWPKFMNLFTFIHLALPPLKYPKGPKPQK